MINLIEWERRRATLNRQTLGRSEMEQVVYRFDIKIQGEDETVFFDI